MKRIGIDVGGTNTDAALLYGTAVLATAKAPTTANTLTGVVRSLKHLRWQDSDGKLRTGCSHVHACSCAAHMAAQCCHCCCCPVPCCCCNAGLQGGQAVMVGTTQFINAVIEQKQLSKVLAVRLCGTAIGALPPFTGMPHHLTQLISAGYLLASGVAV